MRSTRGFVRQHLDGTIPCRHVRLSFVDHKRLQAMIHKAAFLLKIRFFRFLKLLVHNQALYRPMQRQASQSEMIPRALHGNTPGILPKVEWSRWCRTLRVPGKSSRKAQLQVVKQATEVRTAAHARGAAPVRPPVRNPTKRRMPVLPKAKATRRTPFRLRVLNPLVRPGRNSRDVR